MLEDALKMQGCAVTTHSRLPELLFSGADKHTTQES